MRPVAHSPFSPARRILVVDDEQTLREVVAETFRDAGYEVDTAPNGAEALQRIERSRPDLIVLDLMMPVMDAVAFTRLARLNPRSADVPIVILTAAYQPEEQARRLGATACLTKPFNLEELLAIVERVLAADHRLPLLPPNAGQTAPGSMQTISLRPGSELI